MQALLSRASEQLSAMTPQALANVVWALAKLKASPGPLWLGAFLEESFARLSLMNPQVRLGHAPKGALKAGINSGHKEGTV